MDGVKVRYLVPRLSEHGGIQEFAKAQTVFSGLFAVDLRDWSSPEGGRTRTAIRRIWKSLAPGSAKGPRPYDLTHHWHISSALDEIVAGDVLTCHGSEVLRRNAGSLATRALYRRSMGRAGALTVPSEFTRNYIADEYGLTASEIRVTSPGVAAPVTIRPRMNPSSHLSVGLLSRLVPRKNASGVIDAMRLLHDEVGGACSFNLAGDGPLRAELLDSLAKSGVNYRYWGGLTDAEKWQEFYPALDVFALPTLDSAFGVEGFGIVYLEANSCGVPVVAARVGGVSDAVSHGMSGRFVEADDPQSIAEGILHIAERYGHYSGGATAWAAAHSSRRTAESFATLYRELTRGG